METANTGDRHKGITSSTRHLWFILSIFVVVTLMAVASFLYFSDTGAPSMISGVPTLADEDFVENKENFLSFVNVIKRGEAEDREDGVVGFAVPDELEKLGITLIVSRDDCIFFELQGSTFASRGVVFHKLSLEELKSVQPPTEDKIYGVKEIDKNWAHYLAN